MTVPQFSQEADLRVALRSEGRYQLLFFARLQGFDLYAGPGGLKSLLRSSWHGTGKVHIHTPEGRKVGAPRVMPEEFRGCAKLYSGGYSGTDWSYRPKPDSPTRRTLILESIAVERGLSLDLWAVEPQRDDLVAEILAEYRGLKGIELISHTLVDWTRPQLMAVAGTLTAAAGEASRRSSSLSAHDPVV